ncbi:UNKNOWN [Stylonychia lemnae]|uniref:Uncharacterized protein n=1 Tax=Stylonychia lemnae TaxID=5949 RepID=A0A077ZSZ1_STYLE|nr:UNKNOWN [Stylonychia lemnae]|eukprot:CDW73003.1 UNKNOWN [Stylonychia lemnae]
MLHRSSSFTQEKIRKRNCLWIFSLQTGISILIVVDLFSLAALVSLFIYSTIDDVNNAGKRTGYLSFQIFTDGIIVMLFASKCYFGFQFLSYSCCLKKTKVRSKTMKKSSDQNNSQNAEGYSNLNLDRFKMQKTKNERRQLSRYFIFSVVTYFFTIIQSSSLAIIFIYEASQLYKVVALAVCAIFALIYVQRKIFQLLEEKDTELRLRSVKRGVDNIDTLGSEDDKDSERGSHYKPPAENSTDKSYRIRNQMD